MVGVRMCPIHVRATNIDLPLLSPEYNPRYFDEPEKYKPSRWYGVSNESEIFSAFSVGTYIIFSDGFEGMLKIEHRAPCMHRQKIRDNGGGVFPGRTLARLESGAHVPEGGDKRGVA